MDSQLEVGIPYARQEVDGNVAYARCPACGERFARTAVGFSTDEDAATKGANQAYTEHYAQAHAEGHGADEDDWFAQAMRAQAWVAEVEVLDQATIAITTIPALGSRRLILGWAECACGGTGQMAEDDGDAENGPSLSVWECPCSEGGVAR